VTVLVERSMHPGYLSNAYLVADGPGGTAVFVDSGAPLAPLLEAVEREGLTVTHVLTTHGHHDHVEGHDELQRRFGVPAVGGSIETGGLRVESLPTPGHSPDGVSFVVNGEACFSGDTLFKDAVGGSRDDFAGVRRSVMDVLMTLPHETRVLPGHTDETTVGREWEHNPFVRVWRGVDPEGTEPCRVAGEEATLVVWSPDYDGKGKAWVRFADGRDAIVGGSRVERI
jgi:glyoxylase-like metal-dependent hydrolase (beta-lactamase superfamily II)